MKLLLIAMLLLVGCSQVAKDVIEDPQDGTTPSEIVEETIEEVKNITTPKSWTIVAFGDSLTAGPGVAENETYPAVLEQLLKERGYDVTVINAGVNGESSAGARARIDEVLSYEPDIVILETGINDILRGTPPEETAANINAVIDELQEDDVEVILAGMEAFGQFQGFDIQVQTLYPQIAEQQGVEFIPFFLGGVAGVPEYNLPDYVHPNAAGHHIIAEQNVLPAVLEVIEGQ